MENWSSFLKEDLEGFEAWKEESRKKGADIDSVNEDDLKKEFLELRTTPDMMAEFYPKRDESFIDYNISRSD